MKYRYSEEQLRQAVANSLSLSQVCRELNIVPVGGNFKTLRLKIKAQNLDISHFTGKAWNVGTRFRSISTKYSLKEILVEDSPYRTPSKLRIKLIQAGLKEHKCEICENTKWLSQDIKLEIHHINGINTDNRIENLQILCPNCHAFTDNFRGKNIKKSALSEKRDVEYRKFKEALTDHADGNLEPSLIKEGAETLHGKPKSVEVKMETCKGCEKLFHKRNSKNIYCSSECYRKHARYRIPKVPELLEKFEQLKSYLKVGAYYQVSDNAVRKWCEFYGITDMVKKKSSAQTE